MALSNVRLCFVQDAVREYLFCLVGCFLRWIEDFEDMLLEPMIKVFGFRKYLVAYAFRSRRSYRSKRGLYIGGYHPRSYSIYTEYHSRDFMG
jgi:hypothetical protein